MIKSASFLLSIQCRSPAVIAVVAILLIAALAFSLNGAASESTGAVRRSSRSFASECTPNKTLAPASWFAIAPAAHPDPTNVRAVDWLSQDDEDWFAWFNYFYGMSGLTVLESGALDGHLFSTSDGLTRSLGWRAIHLEPGLSNFRGLVKNRPESANFHVAREDKNILRTGDAGSTIAPPLPFRPQSVRTRERSTLQMLALRPTASSSS